MAGYPAKMDDLAAGRETEQPILNLCNEGVMRCDRRQGGNSGSGIRENSKGSRGGTKEVLEGEKDGI